MRPRFQADNDLRSSIRRGVLRRERLIDFQSALDAELDGLSDYEVLRIAASEGRIVISHDTNSMAHHFRAFLASENSSPGLFLVSQGSPVSEVIESILLVWMASDSDEWRNRVIWLPL